MSSMAEMQVFVKMGDGATVAVDVQPYHTLGQVKCMVLPRRMLSSCSGEDAVYLSMAGKPLRDDWCVMDCGIERHSTLGLGVRMRGGGGDGGATGAESRDCYLNMYAVKKPDKVDPNEVKLAKFTNCTVSSEPLKPPCVIDGLGNLYNKEAVVSALVSKSLPKKLQYIKGLKDLITIHLTPIPGINPDDERTGAKFQCPITGQEFNGKFKFCALRKCGHVLSARAMKEVDSTSCAVCHVPFTDADRVPINGNEDEVLKLRERMEADKARIRDKKEKKIKPEKVALGEEIVADSTLLLVEESNGESETHGTVNGMKRKGGQILEAVMRPKGSDLVSVVKKYKASEHIPANATKSVYASIFTSSSKGTFKETYSCRSLPLGRN
ncbi:unnamed protein product [Sphagnum jensenii]|uniref:Ubiquitin-like domain-containing protein n=1 Tax=Sphagnum jensenii TaxID=128206 RepID=A0ABP1A2T5_9BRYO